MLGPDDTYKKFELSLEQAKKDLAAASANLRSPDDQLRQQAESTVKTFGEMSKTILGMGPDSPPPMPPADASAEQMSIWSLAGLKPVIEKDSANSADKARQRLATKALQELDAFAGMVARASKQTGGRVA